jgi:DNA ligase-4
MDEFSKFYDSYGDSFFELLDEQALKDICDNITTT